MSHINKRPRVKISILVMAVVYLLGGPGISQAATVDRDFMSMNDILFYDPSQLVCAASGTKVRGDNNIAKMWNYLIDKGLTDFQAAGILGNIQQESGFSAFRQEGAAKWPLGGYGIVQWTADRRRAMEADMKKTMPDIYDKYYKAEFGGATKESNGYVPEGVPVEINDRLLAYQLDYLYQESTTRKLRLSWLLAPLINDVTEWEAIKASKTIRAASDIWLFSFERPADQSEDHAKKRAGFGEEIYQKMKGGSSSSLTASVSSSDVCNNTTGDTGSFSSTVLAYAWPTYRGRSTEKKKEYEEAVSNAISQGKYVGSCRGVDCGAFVTILLNNSGFDPEYNSSGKGGATGSCNNPGTQWGYLCKNWTLVGRGNTIDTASLQPGDVAMYDGHTFVYVGDIEGFESNIASASQCGRAPMAGKESITDPRVHWYRKKGA